MREPKFWTGSGPLANAWGALLSPLGALYVLGVRLRQARTHPFRPKARVLCVGNLTVGGSGKTPVAIALGRYLSARNKKIVFLTRGYGGRLRGPVKADPGRQSAAEIGDEAALLACQAQTVVARNRAAGAELAEALGADIIVMDDGFQNFRIAKDLSLVVIDAGSAFGNGKCLPAGPLREPASSGLARADAVILMGDGTPDLPFSGPVLRARLVPNSPDVVRGRTVYAFAGIGRPKRFFEMLRGIGAHVAAAADFADHHKFTHLEISSLKNAAQKRGALLVTTEKDFARLHPSVRHGVVPIPVHASFDDEIALGALLERLFAKAA